MLVENAIKHNVISKKKPLHISLEIGKDEIVITNNLQRKLTQEKSTHFGLKSIQTRYDLLGKKEIKIEETKTDFKVTIPILEE
jgi:two-component sensor histidine kinase